MRLYTYYNFICGQDRKHKLATTDQPLASTWKSQSCAGQFMCDDIAMGATRHWQDLGMTQATPSHCAVSVTFLTGPIYEDMHSTNVTKCFRAYLHLFADVWDWQTKNREYWDMLHAEEINRALNQMKWGRCLYGPVTTPSKQMRQNEHTHSLCASLSEPIIAHQESEHLQNTPFYSCMLLWILTSSLNAYVHIYPYILMHTCIYVYLYIYVTYYRLADYSSWRNTAITTQSCLL